MKIVDYRPSTDVIGLNQVDPDKHIIAGLRKDEPGRIVLLQSIGYCTRTYRVQIFNAHSLYIGNSHGPTSDNWRRHLDNTFTEWHAFETPKEFFQWAAEVSK